VARPRYLDRPLTLGGPAQEVVFGVVGEGFGRSGVCVIRGTRNYLTGRSGKYFYNMKMSSYWDDRLED
jgi:hypothetical protein